MATSLLTASGRAQATIELLLSEREAVSVRAIMRRGGCGRDVAAAALRTYRQTDPNALPPASPHPPALAHAQQNFQMLMAIRNLFLWCERTQDRSEASDRIRRLCYAHGIAEPGRKRMTAHSLTEREEERDTEPATVRSNIDGGISQLSLALSAAAEDLMKPA